MEDYGRAVFFSIVPKSDKVINLIVTELLRSDLNAKFRSFNKDFLNIQKNDHRLYTVMDKVSLTPPICFFCTRL